MLQQILSVVATIDTATPPHRQTNNISRQMELVRVLLPRRGFGTHCLVLFSLQPVRRFAGGGGGGGGGGYSGIPPPLSQRHRSA